MSLNRSLGCSSLQAACLVLPLSLAAVGGEAFAQSAGQGHENGSTPRVALAQPFSFEQLPTQRGHDPVPTALRQCQIPMMQEESQGPDPGRMEASQPTSASPSVAAFQAAVDKMHHDMAITYTGNADRDFAAVMIPHHQGAIDMAQVVLQYGSDPEVRKLAQVIIAWNKRQIAFLQNWLAKKRVSAPSDSPPVRAPESDADDAGARPGCGTRHTSINWAPSDSRARVSLMRGQFAER